MSTHEAERVRFALRPPQAVTHSSAVVYRPAEPATAGDVLRPAFVLAHGAGTDLTNVLLRAVGRNLACRGYPVMTFNFAYAEAGRKRPDPAARLESAYRDAVAFARAELFGDRPLLLGGRSMGGRIASQIVAAGEPCAGLAFLGYPLHPPGRPEQLRTAHWPHVTVPMLFVQGDRDRLCDLDLLAQERSVRLVQTASRLEVVTHADHGFAVPAADGRSAADVRRELVQAIASWADGLDLAPAPAVTTG